MEFFKTKGSKANFSDNTLEVSGPAAVLFVHENEKMEKKIALGRGVALEIFSVYSKNAKIKNSFSLSENCQLEIHDVFFGNVGVENTLPLESKGCTLNLVAKGTVGKNESANYAALASISKNAVNSEVNLEEHAYLLEKGAKADLIPGLEISNSEVNAKHASTLREIDGEQLFYMMSRGLPGKKAREEIVRGFLSHELEKIKNQFGYEVRT